MAERVRWERIGTLILAVAFVVLEFVAENYPAMGFAVVATIFMMLYFDADDAKYNAMVTCVKMHHYIQSIEGKDDGDAEAQS